MIGGAVTLTMIVFVVTPIIQNQIYSFGANSTIKAETRCNKYKDKYVSLMRNKQNSELSQLIEEMKKDKCTK